MIDNLARSQRPEAVGSGRVSLDVQQWFMKAAKRRLSREPGPVESGAQAPRRTRTDPAPSGRDSPVIKPPPPAGIHPLPSRPDTDGPE